MVSGGGVIAKAASPGRPLARPALRALLPAVAVVLGLLLLTRTGVSRYALATPALTLFVVTTVVIAGLRIAHDRSVDLTCWSVAAGAAVLLGLSRLGGQPSGFEPGSAGLFPVAIVLLAVALLTLPHRGVAAGQPDGPWSRLACDALVAGFAVLFFAGEYVLVPDASGAGPLPLT